MLFLVDSMLGNVARKLQLFGYDSKYDSGIDDLKIIEIAKTEERIIISKAVVFKLATVFPCFNRDLLKAYRVSTSEKYLLYGKLLTDDCINYCRPGPPFLPCQQTSINFTFYVH